MLGYFNRLPGFLSEVNSFHFSRNSTRNVLIGRIIMTRKQNPVWKNLRRLFGFHPYSSAVSHNTVSHCFLLCLFLFPRGSMAGI